MIGIVADRDTRMVKVIPGISVADTPDALKAIRSSRTCPIDESARLRTGMLVMERNLAIVAPVKSVSKLLTPS